MKLGFQNIKYLYVATDKSKYEFPIAVADSSAELARMLGMRVETVRIYLSRPNSHFYKIYVGDED